MQFRSRFVSQKTVDTLVALVVSACVCAALAVTIHYISILFPTGARADWDEIYVPATNLWARGGNPYDVTGFFSAPWMLPVFWMIQKVGGGFAYEIWLSLVFIAWAFVARRMGAHALETVLFLLSPSVLFGLHVANYESVSLAGMFIPGPVGLLLLAVKPNLNIGTMAFRAKSYRDVAFVLLCLAVSFLLYGLWPLRGASLLNVFWNMSPFPYLVPAGIVLAILAYRKRDIRYAIPVGLCFSPYFAMYSLALVGVALLRNRLALGLFVAAQWLYVVYGALSH